MRAGVNWKAVWNRNKGLCILYIAECLLILCLLPGLFLGKGRGYAYTGDGTGDVRMEMNLPAGIYEVQLKYAQTGENASTVRLEEAEGRYRHLFANEIFLEEERLEAKAVFWIPFFPSEISLQVIPGENADLSVESISVEPNNQRNFIMVFLAAVLSLILDTGLYCRDKWKSSADYRERKMVFFALAGIIALVSLPLLVDYCMDAERLRFHLLRIEEVKNGLVSGRYPAREATEPGAVFYGNLFLMFPAMLRMIGFPVQDAWRIFLLALNVVTAWVAYACFRQIFESRRIGLVGSMLYAWAPYRIYDLYIRAELGESMALCFLPIVCLGFYRILSGDTDGKNYRWVWVLPTLGFFGVQQSYFVSFEIAGAAFLLGMLLCHRKVRGARLTALLKTALAVLVTNFGGLWAAVMHFRKEPPFYAADPVIQHRGMYFAQYFSVFNRTGSFVPAETSMKNAAPRGIGFALTGLMLLYLWICFTGRYRERAEETGEGKGFGNTALWVGAAALLMSTVSFPWDALRKCHWTLDKLISDMQTPACMVPVVIVCFVLAACQMLRQIQRRESGKAAYAVIGAAVLTAFLTTQFLIGNVLREKPPLRIYDETAIVTVRAEILQ